MDNVEAVTLFVQDLNESKRFYSEGFSAEPVYEDDVSWAFSLGNLIVNLLQTSEAFELVDPLKPGEGGVGPRLLLTCRVDDVDATCRKLQQIGIALLNGPVDRSWGRRTAAFADPDGHCWELAQEL